MPKVRGAPIATGSKPAGPVTTGPEQSIRRWVKTNVIMDTQITLPQRLPTVKVTPNLSVNKMCIITHNTYVEILIYKLMS